MPKILKLFIEKGFLLDKEMLDFLNEFGDENIANEIIEKIAITSCKKIITKNLVNENIDKLKFFELDNEKKKVFDRYFVNMNRDDGIKNEENADSKAGGGALDNRAEEEAERKNAEGGRVRVLSSPVLSSQKLEVKDFVRHFRNRYVFLKKTLQERPELEYLTSIDKITSNKNFSIIAIVTDKQITKNKNIILEVEDLTGSAKLLISQNKEEILKKSKEILVDDVIGFKCSGSRDFLFVDDLFYPDIFLNEKNRSEEEVYALFISDIHVGSNNFLEKNFERFIKWLGGEGCDKKQKENMKKIKYMFVVGDSIDGVGVYPGQEKDLKIKDIVKQYEKLAEYYQRVPKHISIIQCAGQHDAVRLAEPQPPIGEDFGESLQEIENLHLVSNPSLIEIEGFETEPEFNDVSYTNNAEKIRGKNSKGIKVLMYHGASMHGIINEIEELRLSNAHSTPAKVVKHILMRRHLSPSHGVTTYIPNATEDSMLIKEVPDIVTTGDLHRPDVDSYNGILIIANSCWQSITAFEEKVGNQPDPCKVPILNLKTMEVRLLDFSDEIDEYKVEAEVVGNEMRLKELKDENRN